MALADSFDITGATLIPDFTALKSKWWKRERERSYTKKSSQINLINYFFHVVIGGIHFKNLVTSIIIFYYWIKKEDIFTISSFDIKTVSKVVLWIGFTLIQFLFHTFKICHCINKDTRLLCLSM